MGDLCEHSDGIWFILQICGLQTVTYSSVRGLLSSHYSDRGKTVKRRIITDSVFEISSLVFPEVSNYRCEGQDLLHEYWVTSSI